MAKSKNEMSALAKLTGTIGGLGGFLFVLGETEELGAAAIAGLIGWMLGGVVGEIAWKLLVAAIVVLLWMIRLGAFANYAASL